MRVEQATIFNFSVECAFTFESVARFLKCKHKQQKQTDMPLTNNVPCASSIRCLKSNDAHSFHLTLFPPQTAAWRHNRFCVPGITRHVMTARMLSRANVWRMRMDNKGDCKGALC
jgi:hypothetical protein